MKNSKIIDLSNLKPTNLEEQTDFKIKSKIERKKFYPMYLNPKDAKNASKSKTIHLAIPGLMPASPDVWENYKEKNQIFYMPNDKKPHFHGDAPHHFANFSIKKVWIMSKNKYKSVKNKRIESFRSKKGIVRFNNGKSSTPIETWIHWRIPYDSKDYPDLIIRKNSIIWWDFTNMHNLILINNENDYKKNNFNIKNSIKISDNVTEKETLVTIMDKVGIFFFVCSTPGHAQSGHKIKIKVI
jgi:hypothetical protein